MRLGGSPLFFEITLAEVVGQLITSRMLFALVVLHKTGDGPGADQNRNDYVHAACVV